MPRILAESRAGQRVLVVFPGIQVPECLQVGVGGDFLTPDLAGVHALVEEHGTQAVVRKKFFDMRKRDTAIDCRQWMWEAVDLHHRDIEAARQLEHLRYKTGDEQRHVAARDIRGVDVCGQRLQSRSKSL